MKLHTVHFIHTVCNILPRSTWRCDWGPVQRRSHRVASHSPPAHLDAGLQPTPGALWRLWRRRGGTEGREQPGREIWWFPPPLKKYIKRSLSLTGTCIWLPELSDRLVDCRQEQTTRWGLITTPRLLVCTVTPQILWQECWGLYVLAATQSL